MCAGFGWSNYVFPHAAENVNKLCKPQKGDPRCQKEQLCFDLSIHFCGCTDSKPLIISMSLFKCVCTNLTSNKSVTIKISFQFTQAMLQLLYQSQSKYWSSPIVHLLIHPSLLCYIFLWDSMFREANPNFQNHPSPQLTVVLVEIILLGPGSPHHMDQ